MKAHIRHARDVSGPSRGAVRDFMTPIPKPRLTDWAPKTCRRSGVIPIGTTWKREACVAQPRAEGVERHVAFDLGLIAVRILANTTLAMEVLALQPLCVGAKDYANEPIR